MKTVRFSWFFMGLLPATLVFTHGEPFARSLDYSAVNATCVDELGNFRFSNCDRTRVGSLKVVRFLTTSSSSSTTTASVAAPGGPIRNIYSTHQTMHVLYESGVSVGWGENVNGILGTGNVVSPVYTAPEQMRDTAGFAQGIENFARFGSSHICYRKTDGSVWCTGANEHGDAGTGVASPVVNFATRVVALNNGGPGLMPVNDIWHSVRSGSYASIRDGSGILRMFSWGINFHYDRASVDPSSNIGNRQGLTVAQYTTHFTEDPVGSGQLYVPYPVEGADLEAALNSWRSSGFTVKKITHGRQHSCALLEQAGVGRVRCWGLNNEGQLGRGHNNWWSEPNNLYPSMAVDVVAVGGGPGSLTDVEDIHALPHTTCAIVNNGASGKVACWGLNNYGQLGAGLNSWNRDDNSDLDPIIQAEEVAFPLTYQGDSPFPNWVKNEDGSDLQNIAYLTAKGESAIRGMHTSFCVITVNAGIKCWGGDRYGECGRGLSNWNSWRSVAPAKYWDGQDRIRADFVEGFEDAGMNAVSFTCGKHFCCALTDTGELRCWGYNEHGVLGRGDNAPTSNPSQAPVTIL